jgi:CheY-like chemotaxis protein
VPDFTEPIKPLILVVDDDPGIRMLLEFILRKQFRVELSEDGLDAMARMARGRMPDLIMTDLEMPQLTGLELLEQIRCSGLFQDIPVILLSGHHALDVKQRCLDAGADQYLIKPFNPDSVIHAIRSALARAA